MTEHRRPGIAHARCTVLVVGGSWNAIGIPSHLSLPPCRYPTLSLSRHHRAPSLIEYEGMTKDKMNTKQRLKSPAPIFIGRWTPEILFSLKERPRRHGELRRDLGGVSQRMLTRTLRSLESTGLINKRVTRSKTIAVEYSLTGLGKTIIAPLKGMCRWATRYRKDVSAQVHLPEPSHAPVSQHLSSG